MESQLTKASGRALNRALLDSFHSSGLFRLEHQQDSMQHVLATTRSQMCSVLQSSLYKKRWARHRQFGRANVEGCKIDGDESSTQKHCKAEGSKQSLPNLANRNGALLDMACLSESCLLRKRRH